MSAFAPGAAAAQSFTLTGFSSFLATSTAATIRWGVYAADRLAPASLYTTAVAGAAATNPTLTKLGNSNTALSSFINVTNLLGTHATSANGWALQTIAPTSSTDASYGGNILGANGNFSSNLSFNTTGALGDSLSFLRFNNANAGSSTRTAFADTWQLNSGTGTLVYTAPVPEPGTYALMLAGLFTLGAVARRRTK
jgi:PEP-CTERM motif